VKSQTTKQFRDLLAALPEPVQRQAREAYQLFKTNPAHPSLHLKRLHTKSPLYSARVGTHYRVLGLREPDAMVWFWIGSHAEYDKLLAQR
jgi:mRNA-degrading endonuclease RelE of RelBE toxin-antitoxin system